MYELSFMGLSRFAGAPLGLSAERGKKRRGS